MQPATTPRHPPRPLRPLARPASIALAAAGSLLSLATVFLPWYQVGPGHAARTLAGQDPVMLAPMAAVILAGGALVAALARGQAPAARTLRAIFTLTFATTLAVVFTLFIHRPGGNAATMLAFGGYPALLGINLVKASAVITLAASRVRPARAPGRLPGEDAAQPVPLRCL